MKDKYYQDQSVQGYVDEICSKVTKELVDSNKPFKYLGIFKYSLLPTCHHCALIARYFISMVMMPVSCVIMQKNGAGIHSSNSCYWDATNDNVVIVKWPSEKKKDPNARCSCIVSVYGIAY